MLFAVPKRSESAEHLHPALPQLACHENLQLRQLPATLQVPLVLTARSLGDAVPRSDSEGP